MINQTMYKQYQKSKELVQGRKQDFKWAGSLSGPGKISALTAQLAQHLYPPLSIILVLCWYLVFHIFDILF